MRYAAHAQHRNPPICRSISKDHKPSWCKPVLTNRLWTRRAFEVVRIQRRQNLINYCSADLFDTSVCPHLAPGTKVSNLPRTFSSRLRWRKVLINSHLPTVAWCAGSTFRWLFCHLWYRMSTKAAALGFNPKATQLQTISQYSRVLTLNHSGRSTVQPTSQGLFICSHVLQAHHNCEAGCERENIIYFGFNRVYFCHLARS